MPSRERIESKIQPEEPIKKEVMFMCKAEHWELAMQSERNTRSGPPKVVSQCIWVFSNKETSLYIGAKISGICADSGGVRC